MPFPSYISDQEHAGRVIASPLVLLMPEPAVRTLAGIASRATPATVTERQLLRLAIDLIEAAEVVNSRRAG